MPSREATPEGLCAPAARRPGSASAAPSSDALVRDGPGASGVISLMLLRRGDAKPILAFGAAPAVTCWRLPAGETPVCARLMGPSAGKSFSGPLLLC